MSFEFLHPWRHGILTLAFLSLAAGSFADNGCLSANCHQGTMPEQNPHFFDGACETCHQRISGPHPGPAGSKEFSLTASGAQLCQECHESFAGKRTIHSPVQEGECILCHNVHGQGKNLLVQAGDDLTALCTQCHDSEPFSREVVHGPVAIGACTECHDPHQADRSALLTAPGRDLCLRCHVDMGQGLAGAPVIHQAVKEQECTVCHDPHGSANPRLVRERVPELCLKCHPKVGERAKAAKVPHAPVRRAESCSGCHATHFSNAPKLLPFPEQELCLSCHGKDESRRSRGLRNIAKELKGKEVLHGPLADGSCSACHDPHGSDYYRLLSKSYPEGIYAPYQEGTYAFCFQCHDPLMLRFPDTTIYTGFRNGNDNLHYVHVVDSRKGRTCRTCHQPHASDAPKLISSSGVEFGDWKIPIQFKKTETGGSCAPGCHRAVDYDRGQAMEKRKTSP